MNLKPMYALVKDLFFATKIVKTAEAAGFRVRAFDSAERLLQASEEEVPSLLILDCEGLEKEAFEILRRCRLKEALSKIQRIGYLSHGARELKQEMQSAGCERVYTKSEFAKELEQILLRYGDGLSPRI